LPGSHLPFGGDLLCGYRFPHLALRRASIDALKLAAGSALASEVSVAVSDVSGVGDGRSSVLSIAGGT
jgi:hypothetical protein